MKAYRFRFEGLLQKKISEEKDIQNEMSPIVSKYNQILAKIEELSHNSLSLTSSSQATASASLPSTIFSNFTLKSVYLETVKNLKKTRASVEEKLKLFQQKLQQKIIERKAIQLLKDKEFKAFLKKKTKQQQFALEDNFYALHRQRSRSSL